MVAAGGSVGLPECIKIRAECGDSKERIDRMPRIAERQAGTLLGGGGVLLRIGITEGDTVGLARGLVRTSVDTVGAGETTRDRGDVGRRGDSGHRG
ncbi:MAG TPA: hypothetical protein DIW30_04935 [Bacteroidales bacterium]|nr:hypothetical protein [Bacteroidales bacterium]